MRFGRNSSAAASRQQRRARRNHITVCPESTRKTMGIMEIPCFSVFRQFMDVPKQPLPAILRNEHNVVDANPCLCNPSDHYDQRAWFSNAWRPELAIKLWWLLNYRLWSRTIEWNPHRANLAQPPRSVGSVQRPIYPERPGRTA